VARLYPADISRLQLAGGATAELETLARLHKDLTDDYAVFHGVHWSRDRAGLAGFGEIDFVVVNRAGSVLLIEQKNGDVEEGRDGLVKRYADGPKNVGQQIARSVAAVKERLRPLARPGTRLDIGYIIYCPDARIRMVNAAAIERHRVVDAGEAPRLAECIADLLPAESGDAAWTRTVEAFFRQTFELLPDIHAHVGAQHRAFTRMSGDFLRFFEGIEMRDYRLRLSGVAGCGKSLVARHAFERAVARGRRPLLLCYNRALKEKLKATAGPGGIVETWNGFCKSFLDGRGDPLDFESQPDSAFWKDVEQRVSGHTVPEDWRFDSIIVDEGQDFEPEWWEILRLFARPETEWLWLEDPDQNVRGVPPVRLDGFVTLRVRGNFRLPATIAAFVRAALPEFAFDPVNALPGRGARVHWWNAPGDQVATLAAIITERLREGFAAEDIVVLTTRGLARSALAEQGRVGAYTIRRFENRYDEFGNQIYTEGQIRFDTVRRFKGGEAPAVILIDVDPEPRRLDQELRVLYAGMTRATVALDVLARRGNAANERLEAAIGAARAAMV
jgi:hypothetical protein